MNFALGLLRTMAAAAWIAGLVVLLALAAVAQFGPHVGWTAYAVRGASMEPALPIGSLALVNTVAPATIVAGDVVSFRSEAGTVTTHRVVEAVEHESQLHFRMQGDASGQADPWLVPAARVVGRVSWVIPYAGILSFYLSTLPGLMTAVSLMGTLMLSTWWLDEARTARLRRIAASPQRESQAIA
jgi:signal peptidase